MDVHTKKIKNRVNDLREWTLRITYQDRISSFDESLKIDKSVSIHHRNLQYLLIEIYKSKNDILSLDQNTSYNLRAGVIVTRRNLKRNKFGFKSVNTIGSILWGKVPSSLKTAANLNIFKHKIKKRTQKLPM